MKARRFRLPLALAALSIVGIDAAAQTPSAPTAACVALTMPSVQGVEDATSFATAVRDLFASYLKGPTIRTISLESRLQSQALLEARGQQCGYVLLVTLERKPGGGNSTGRILGQAAGVAVTRAPVYGGAAGAAASSATWASGEAIYRYASEVRAKDELELSYRLGTPDAVERAKPVALKAKAKSNGEDLLTPLVEKAANGIVATTMLRSVIEDGAPGLRGDAVVGLRGASPARGQLPATGAPRAHPSAHGARSRGLRASARSASD